MNKNSSIKGYCKKIKINDLKENYITTNGYFEVFEDKNCYRLELQLGIKKKEFKVS